MMKVRILGCSGGIGGDLRTTSMLLDDDVLIDAGTGVGDLSISALASIDHVFLTHSHMDHVGFIPFVADTVGWMRAKPITIHATRETLTILKEHLFNWKLWPDFSQIPSPSAPVLLYQEIEIGSTVTLVGNRRITALPANHVVPAVGYQLDSGRRSLVFTGDTTTNDALWPSREPNRQPALPDYRNGAVGPRVRARRRVQAPVPQPARGGAGEAHELPEIYITHLKPREAELIMEEISRRVKERRPRMLSNRPGIRVMTHRTISGRRRGQNGKKWAMAGVVQTAPHGDDTLSQRAGVPAETAGGHE